MFRKVLMTIGLLLAANVAVLAQGTLKGTVTDAKSGETMPFVNVVAMQGGQQVGGGQTDFDGIYTIKALPVGSYDIKVSSVGYETQIKTGVNVKASGFTVENFNLKPSATMLETVEIITEKVPVIEVGSAESGQRLSSDDIARMPGTSIESIVAAVGGVGYDDGGTGTARGEDNMVQMQGNVRKRTGVTAPKEAIAEIQVILGGTPASIGEAIGGTQIITLKPPSSQFKGVIKYEGYFDYRLANSLMVYLTGPAYKKKIATPDGGMMERTLVGFRFTGQGSYSYQGLYRAKEGRFMKVNDELVRQYEQHPLAYDAITGTMNYAPEQGLYKEHFKEFKRLTKKDFDGDASRVPNLRTYSIATEGALDFRFSDYATLTLTGEFSMGHAPNTDDITAYMALNAPNMGNAVYDYRNYAITVDWTQRFPDAEVAADATMPEAKSAAAISNIMYNVTGMFNRYTIQYYNETFGSSLDDVFKYGHVGFFRTEKVPTYELQNYNYNGINTTAMVQNNWADYTTYEGGSTYNPILANYNNQLFYDDEMQDVRPYLSNIDFIRMFKGLFNGDSPSNIYGLFYGVGTQNRSFSMNRADYIYFQAKASALIKGHDVEIGFQYDRSSTSSYGVGATSLWTLMRQNANRHILQMNTDNPSYHWEDGVLYVDYDRIINEGDQSNFDAAMRQHLGLGATDWLDVDRYDPQTFVDAGGLNMFSANELFNGGGSNVIVSYAGYDHAGNLYKAKDWNLEKFFNADEEGHQYIPAFTPTYMAGYIQDKFYVNDLIFNVGVRVDYFDGNQYVLKDPYLLYQSYTVNDLNGGSIAYNGDLLTRTDANGNLSNGDWVVYVDDAAATTPTIVGYRNGSIWYDAQGVEVSSPSSIAGKSGKPTPYRTPSGREAAANNTVDGSSDGPFEKYKPQIVVMPRIAFAFPVGDKSQFKASYDIIARRPSSGWQADYVDYLYMSQVSKTNNPNLKPERVTNYELGFQQALNDASAVSISAYYKETRDLIQLVQYAGADPNQNYYSYDNLDFKTIKGFTFGYDLRQTKNIRINANYTLQYAEGTGLSSTTMTELIKEGYTTLKMLNPISDDRRHEFKANVDFRYFGGAKYNGPTITRTTKDPETGELRKKEVKILENFGVNFLAVAQSGRPYTRAFSNTQSTIVGSYRGARLPWGFYFNVVVDKTWPIQVGKRETYLNASVTINNLFDIRNITGVFSVTGNPTDNGYLTDPETQAVINSYLDPDSYRDLYTINLHNSYWNYSTPRIIKLALTYQF